MLACTAGALQSVRCIVELGAYVDRMDGFGNGVVQLAALRYHTNILEYLLHLDHADVRVWNQLVGEQSLALNSTIIYRSFY